MQNEIQVKMPRKLGSGASFKKCLPIPTVAQLNNSTQERWLVLSGVTDF